MEKLRSQSGVKSSKRPPGAPPLFSRRLFLKSVGTTAVATAAAQAETLAAELEKARADSALGPGPVPVTLRINGKTLDLRLEPRVTLLDALRQHTEWTGTKEVCDRGTCGACTVLLDGRPIYSCMKLAIDAQGHDITTVEGLGSETKLSRLQQAFVETDALMCGYCTPGFVVTLSALLARNPRPSAQEVRVACAGNLCRCGTYPRIVEAALHAAGMVQTNKS